LNYRKQKLLFNFLANNLSSNRVCKFNKILPERTKHFVAVVEDIYQERNASAIIRTCDCFGIQELNIIENKNKYKISKHIAKGSENWLDLKVFDEHKNNSQTCLSELKNKGYQIVCTIPGKGAVNISELCIKKKSAIVFGGEKEGITKTALNYADITVKIPTIGFNQSLNISVAAAIIFYELTNRLKRSKINWSLNESEKIDTKINWALKSIKNSDKLLKHFKSLHR